MNPYRRWFLGLVLSSLVVAPASVSGSPGKPTGDLPAAAGRAQGDLVVPFLLRQSAPMSVSTERGACSSDWLAKDGPGPFEECCERHLDQCGQICNCGYTGFNCWDNGHGACSSTCVGCRICL